MEVTERFAALMARPEPSVRLDEAGLLIAAHARPALDVDAELAALDELAGGCRTPTLDGLVRHLFVEQGYRGDHEHYHDPRNSYLDEVRTRRRGIPVTLSVLTIEVGRRLGVPLSGVGMPGHFLLRDKVDREVFVDPFTGAVLDEQGCERLFRALQGPDAPWDPRYLEPVGSHVIVARVLANLKAIFAQRRDRAGLAWVLGLRCLVPGMPADEFAAWAEALVALGRFVDAADVLDAVASRHDGPRADGWRAGAAALRARLN